jgi:hypothetical protein
MDIQDRLISSSELLVRINFAQTIERSCTLVISVILSVPTFREALDATRRESTVRVLVHEQQRRG